MQNMTRGFRIGLILVAALLGNHASAADEAESPEQAGDEANDVSEITLSATDGRVAWSDIIHALAETGRLDASALENLPDGSLNLNGRRTRLALLALDLALPPECSVSVVNGRGDGEPQLLITIDKARMRERTRDVKRRIRERADGVAGDYGLTFDDDWQQAADEGPLVVLIHGYNSDPDSLSVLHERLKKDDWPCGVFAYPNDGPLDESAALLSQELNEFRSEYPDRGVAVVAHSMGGLVARAAIENPDLDPGNVRQLIMVATPNHGSMLAHFPGGLDWFEKLTNRDDDEADGLLARAAADGLNEASADLRPESDFLRRLNARERNPGVRYSLLLGTKAPLTAAELDEFRAVIRTTVRRNRLLQLFSPRIEEPLSDLEELLDGKGDGVVAVKRGRLDGVDDTQLLPVTHFTITHKADDPVAEELLEAVVTRLSSGVE